MPIYEYHCPGCGRDFEELVRGRTHKVACPHCGGRKCRKLMSAAGFISKSKEGATVKSSAGGSCATCGP